MNSARKLRYLFLQLNRGCNLRCTHCDFWKLREVPDGLSEPALLAILDEFADLAGPEGRVVSCGGEPMLALERYFLVAERARKRGLGFLSVTNGSLIKGRPIAERLLREGPAKSRFRWTGPTRRPTTGSAELRAPSK